MPVPPTARLLGRQTPTHELDCPAPRSLGEQAVAFAARAGIELDPWQRLMLHKMLGISDTGIWAVFQFLLIVSRQNGKSEILVVRALFGVFVLGEGEITWSAHRYDTAMDGLKRCVSVIRRNKWLLDEVQLTRKGEIASTSHGDESISLKSGAKIRFKTRTTDGGRGLGGDTVIIDEAQDAQESHLAAMLPTVGARPDPQVIYTGSAGGPRSTIMGDLHHRAFDTKPGDSERDRLYAGAWEAEEDDDPAAEETWAKTNPGYGLRLMPATMQGFWNTWKYRPDYFLREHAGVGNYPRPESETWIIPAKHWEQGNDEHSAAAGQALLAIDAKPDLSKASISLAGYRRDGRKHIQTVAHNGGSRWVVSRLPELIEELGASTTVIMDAKSPLAYLTEDLQDIGLEVRILTYDEAADATSRFLEETVRPEDADDTWQPEVTHLDQPLLTVALAAAHLRKVGDRLLIARHAGDVDASPLTSAVHAAHGLVLLGRKPPEPPAPIAVTGTPSRARGVDVRSMHF